MSNTLRGMRDRGRTFELGGEERNLAMGRAAHLGKGDFENFYEDLGFSTTPEMAQKLREEEAEFQKEKAKKEGQISDYAKKLKSAQSAYAKASKDFPDSYDDALAKAWNNQKKGFKQAKVVDQEGNVMKTFKFAEGGLQNLAKTTKWRTSFDDAGNMIIQGWGSKQEEFEKEVLKRDGGGGDAESKPYEYTNNSKRIMEILDDADKTNYKSFEKQIRPQLMDALVEGKKKLQKAKGQLAANQYELETAKGVLQGQVEDRESQWDFYRDKYQKRKETLNRLFRNMRIG